MKINDEMFSRLADFYKVLGDQTRLRILMLLFEKPCSVQCIAQNLGMTHSAISHQLRVLKQAKHVVGERQGKNVIYSLYDSHIHAIIEQGVDHLSHT